MQTALFRIRTHDTDSISYEEMASKNKVITI